MHDRGVGLVGDFVAILNAIFTQECWGAGGRPGGGKLRLVAGGGGGAMGFGFADLSMLTQDFRASVGAGCKVFHEGCIVVFGRNWGVFRLFN